MAEYVIETQKLTKRYIKHKEAVKSLDLLVPKGSVYVFLGRNGAGKTTTIRMLMGLLQKTSGKSKVLGMDPEKEPVQIKKRVGYVADNQKMYDWMTIEETINFCRLSIQHGIMLFLKTCSIDLNFLKKLRLKNSQEE